MITTLSTTSQKQIYGLQQKGKIPSGLNVAMPLLSQAAK